MEGLTGRRLTVVANAGARALLLTGAPEDIEFAAGIVKQLDARGSASTPVVKTYKIQNGNADSIARVLSDTLGRGQPRPAPGRPAPPPISVSAEPEGNAVVVSGAAEVHATVEAVLAQLDAPEAAEQALTVKLVQLNHAEAESLAAAMNTANGVDARRGARPGQVLLTAEPISNSLLVSGRLKDIQEAMTLIAGLDVEVQLTSQVKIFPIQHAKPEALLEIVQNILVEGPDLAARPRRGGPPQPAAEPVRVALQPDTNSLVVMGPADKVALAEQLVAKFDVPADQAKQTTIEIVQLKNAQAVSLAEAISASLESQASGAAGAPPRRAGRASAETAADKVTVTAEPNSNSLLVRGPAGDVPGVVAMIRRIDDSGTSGTPQIRTFPLKNTDAEDMALSLGKLFTDMIKSQPTAKGASAPHFSIMPDLTNNSLIVSTTPAYYAMFERLLADLDKESTQPAMDITYVTLKNADPYNVAYKLEDLFKSRKGPDAPQIDPDYYTNSLSIIAKEADLKVMTPLIEKMDRAVTTKVQVISLGATSMPRTWFARFRGSSRRSAKIGSRSSSRWMSTAGRSPPSRPGPGPR